ncbi:hypothetical protein Q1W73_15360 [Asticcacaulis sp. ZE23SCel15]|uniref:S10 family peptidase n=1 Tax=Asticcacaulis sp. ZE23SCel15 TaxID=3059027 RepID=UPI00265F090F|nr:hypothetical protein [Asticcacaulis sp. ZE23SCel15]WKL57023.1 hypothetical protein Q1W73_15360 [Asticcacaulis sp. ZE23SCel15]
MTVRTVRKSAQNSVVSALALILCAGAALPAYAQSTPASVAENFAPADFGAAVVTKHKGTFGGQKIDYTATAAPYIVKDKSGRDALSVVTFSYEAKSKTANRPVMFIFNGGPISPSVYLHMGAFAPKRVHMPDDLSADPSTFKLVDNPNAPLEVADLVFIDPAGTGYSRPLPGTDLKDWFSVEADGEQFAQVIRQWVTSRGREASPVYIFGESYGTMRAPQIAKKLAEAETPLTLGGVVLFGQAANIADYVQRPTNIISYVVSLPTLAATAWYHKAVDTRGLSLEAFVAEARTFADTEYLTALYRGGDLPDAERDVVAKKLESYTGVPAKTFADARLRISKEAYRRLLFKDKGLIIGMADTRYTGPLDTGGDPSSVAPNAMINGFPAYARDFLKLKTEVKYLTNSPVTGGLDGWDWGYGKGPFSDWPYFAMLTDVLKTQPKMKIMVGVGWYDTQTTVGGSEYLLKQAGWPKANTRLTYYEGGHMNYSNSKALEKLGVDIRAFLKDGQ